ncbi:MAG: RdgB/HAM1 family non-canonical purine NTP pyrophosphatase [Candidatus Marinimicrobia bacterium]|nr:RdgB/HAM1 family non-canonical purine NTP pyrophosphatase [Candidatus Neomarinimicrobiota bacterium]
MKLVIATRNEDKIREIREIFEGSGFELSSLSEFPQAPEVEETGETLLENALLKAESAANATGLPAIADDTGLFVDALNGEPGVRSSRYAGENVSYEENRKMLLKNLDNVPEAERTARFETIAVLVDEREHFTAKGEVEGLITSEQRGSNGFGYDPIFQSANSEKTFGELTREEKRTISHRGIAFQELLRILNAKYSS